MFLVHLYGLMTFGSFFEGGVGGLKWHFRNVGHAGGFLRPFPRSMLIGLVNLPKNARIMGGDASTRKNCKRKWTVKTALA